MGDGRDATAVLIRRRRVAFLLLGSSLALMILLGLLSGSVALGFGDLVHMVRDRIGLTDQPSNLSDSVLWAIRLPRVLAGVFVGAGLGVAGVGLQGTLRNPIADPHLVGLAPAAGLGAVAGIALTPAGGSPMVMMLAAAAGGVAIGILMKRIAANTLEPGELVLVGLALGLTIIAVLGAIVLAWDSPRVPTFTFWVFGGLAGSTWATLGAATPLIVVGSGVVWSVGRSLDLMALGEDEARHLGVDVRRLTTVTLAAVGVIVGGVVGLSGVIGFVGLVVPLVLRSWVGPFHRSLTVLAALGGATMLVTVDIVARTAAAPIEIPVGLLTAIAGGPVLVWFLLRRTQ